MGGTINMNTNAGCTRAIEELCGIGLDSIRVSLISAREEVYNLYYLPRGYSLGNVQESIKSAVRQGVFVSINLLTYPGLTGPDSFYKRNRGKNGSVKKPKH